MERLVGEFESIVTMSMVYEDEKVLTEFNMFNMDAHDFATKLAEFMKMVGYHPDNVDQYFDLE